MTKRMLHENITTSNKFSLVSFEAECLYNRLLTQTDDYGNVRGTAGYIKDVCFPKGKKDKKIDYQLVDKWLQECINSELLILYKIDGVEYLHFSRFEDFQELRVDRLRKSSIPYYDYLRANDGQMPEKCQHELELELELEVEEELEGKYNQMVAVDSLESLLTDFKQHRKSLKKPMTYKAVELLKNKLNKLADNDADKMKILEQSIEQGWSSVYELLKPKNNTNSSKKLYITKETMESIGENNV